MKLSYIPTYLLLSALIFCGLFLQENTFSDSCLTTEYQLPEKEIQIPATTAAPLPPSLNAKYACVMDAGSLRPLYSKNGTRQVPMASTTKIMTAILALESHCQSDTVTASAKAASMPKVHLGMTAGMKFHMSDLLYSLMLESHNDTAVAIAEHIGQSTEGFARLMNKKAKELGMTHTHFVTPNGLDADNHYSTAEDMCRLAAYAIKNQEFLTLVQTKSHSFTDLSGAHSYSLYNRDSFLSYYDGALGIKTGFTNKAGYCFVGAASRSGTTLTSCVLASGWPPNRSYKWLDTKNLMDYAYQNFYQSEFPIQNLAQAKIPVMDGRKELVSLSSIPRIPILLSRFDKLTIRYDIPDSLYAPVRKETPIGQVTFFINDKQFKVEKVFPIESIEKSSFSDKIERVLHIWMEIFGFLKT